MSSVVVGTAKPWRGIGVANFVTATRPAAPTTGLIIYNTETEQVECWDGEKWFEVGVTQPPPISLYNSWGLNNSTSSTGEAATPLNDVNGATFTTSSKLGSHALSFDGSNDYCRFECPNVNNTWSVGFWIYWRGHNSSGRSYLVDFRPAGEGNCYWLIDSTNEMKYLQADGTERAISFTPTDNTWEHYALVSNDGGVAKIYRNGQLIDTGTQNGDTVSGNANLGTYYGARGGSGQYFMNAIIDEFFFHTSPLTAAQVLEIYNRTESF